MRPCVDAGFHVVNVLFYEARGMKKVIQEANNAVYSVCRLHWRLIKIQSAAFFASGLSFCDCQLFGGSYLKLCTLAGKLSWEKNPGAILSSMKRREEKCLLP